MWNKALRGNDLLRGVVADVATRIPPGWRIESSIEPSTSGRPPNTLLRVIAPDGQEATIVAEIKQQVRPADLEGASRQLESLVEELGADGGLMLARYLSPRSRELLARRDLGWADATGNVRIVARRPALWIEAEGAQRDPLPDRRPIRSLRGRAAGRVVRGLVDLRPPYGVSELANRIAAPVATVYRVISFLEEEALLRREPRGPVTDVDWAGVLRRWTQDYGFTTTNTTVSLLAPRGAVSAFESLRTARLRSAATGSMAARGPRVAPGRLLALYVEDPSEAAATLGLAETEAGANVILARPFDDVVFDRTAEVDGIVLAAASQVAADLMTGPGRWPQEAEAMLEWMQENEDAWRS